MLQLTENATTIVKSIADQPDVSGLRISNTDTEGGFAVTVASGPEADDKVVEEQGASVYLDPAAAEQLDKLVLDAGVDEEGNVQFALGQQG